MSLPVNADSNKEVIKAQKEWLKTLQNVSPRKMIRIKAVEGSKPEEADPELYMWLPYPNIWHKITQPIYTRGILPNEILIDPDTPEWDVMKDGIEKLTGYCKKNNIPFIAGFSGGKGIHVSIFFDSCGVDEELEKGIEETGIDVLKTARRALVKALATKAGVNLDDIRVDWGKINFNFESKGSQIRTFGTTRAPGQYKTLVDEIPNHKPEPFELPLIFPEKVELWELEGTEFKDIVLDALREEVQRAKKANEYTLNDADFTGIEIMKFPCIKKLFESGIEKNRYYAGVSVLLICKKCGISKEETEKHMRELFRTFPGISPAETELRINNALTMYETEKKFSCRELKDYFGEDFCKFLECPMKEKIDKEKKREKETPIREYGNFELYKWGVYYTKTDSKGNITNLRIIDEHTEIIGTSDNLDVDLEDTEVNKFTHYKLRTGDVILYPEHGELLTKAGIVKLIKAGMIASEGDYRYISTYFKHEMVRAKQECEKLKVCNKPGWKRNKSIFVSGNFAYSGQGVVEVILTNPITGQMYKTKGTLEDWLKPELIEWLGNDVARFVFYGAFACFISSYLGVQNIIISITGGTSGGKTLTASVAGSGMGKTGIDDKGESIVRAATITQAAAEYLSVSVNGHYIVFDDTTQGKDYSGLVYMLSNGRKKDRAPNSSLEGGEVYSASYVITGEQGLLKDSVTQGANGRVIEIKNTIESSPENAKKAKVIEDTIKVNYGHLTEPFLKKVFERKEAIQKKYFELCNRFRDEGKDIGGRIGDQMACICIAGEIIEEIFSEIGIPAKDPYVICEKVVDSNATSEQKREYWLRGLEIIYNEISTWTQEREVDGTLAPVLKCGKGLGGNYTGEWMNILESNIRDICEKHQLNKKELLEKWAEKGVTRVDKIGKDGKPKFSKAVLIEGKTKKTISFNIPKVLEILDLTQVEEVGKVSGLPSLSEAIFQEHVKNTSQAWKSLYGRQPIEGEEEDFCKMFFETYPQHKDYYSNTSVILEAGRNFPE